MSERTIDPGIASGEMIILVDGEPWPARAGQSVAGALIAGGRRAWRRTRSGGRRPRGVFCGIGACFDCLATIDDRCDQRACLVPVRPGLRVQTDAGTS